MMDLLSCGRNKLHDPIVMEWALRRYRHSSSCGSDKCAEMERLWFHDLTLRHWLNSDDDDLLADIFRDLPPRLFTNLGAAVLSRWMDLSGHTGAWATPALMKCPPEEVFPLLNRHIEEHASDLNKTRAVFSSLESLPSDLARQLIDKATASVAGLDDNDSGKIALTTALLRSAALHSEVHFWTLVNICAHIVRLDEKRSDQMLRAIFRALMGSGVLMTLVEHTLSPDPDLSYSSLAGLFQSDAPLEECDHLVREAEPWPRAKNLLEAKRNVSAAVEKACAVCALFEEQAEADPEALTSFAVASVLSAFEIDRIDASSLSLEETLDLLALDVPECRHFEQLAQRLAEFEPKAVADEIISRLPAVADLWGGQHLVEMAGHLRLDSTAPLLLDCLTEEKGDFLCEAAQDALARIGEPATLLVVERWDSLDRSQKIYGGGLLQKVGGEAACSFALHRFNEFLHDDYEEWCDLIAACPDVRAIPLIETQLARKQPPIDEVYYLLCMLADDDSIDLEAVRQRVWKNRKDMLAHRANFEAGNLDALFKTLTLTLRCEKCDEVNRYDVKSVLAGQSSSGFTYFVRDDLCCASCGQWPDFEFTPDTYMQISSALIAYSLRKKTVDAGGEELFQFVNVNYRYQTRPATDVIAELKSDVKKYPDDVVNHLRQARVQYILGRRGRAEECYRTALRLQPNSMEAGLGVAQTLADAGQQSQAFDRLCQMLEAKSNWRFFRTDEISPNSLDRDFVRLFNKLRNELGVGDRPLLHGAVVESRRKVGRNDPCPCGSGAKYKKCCGAS